MAWGDKKAQQRRDAVENGGTLSGRQAKKAARSGGLGDDGKVRDTKGRVTGDFSRRTPKRGNEHGV
jgi:hypothetical protein